MEKQMQEMKIKSQYLAQQQSLKEQFHFMKNMPTNENIMIQGMSQQRAQKAQKQLMLQQQI